MKPGASPGRPIRVDRVGPELAVRRLREDQFESSRLDRTCHRAAVARHNWRPSVRRDLEAPLTMPCWAPVILCSRSPICKRYEDVSTLSQYQKCFAGSRTCADVERRDCSRTP